MPRERKPARLWKKPASNGRSALWIIKDGNRSISTGVIAKSYEVNPPEEAERSLNDYLTSKYSPPERIRRDIDSIAIATVLAIYHEDRRDDLETETYKQRFDASIRRLNEFFGDTVLGSLSDKLCKDYVKHRGNLGGSRRDLENLRAAIGHHAKQNLHHAVIHVTLPEKGKARERWLTRDEAAKLLWAAWSHREVQTIHIGKNKGQKVVTVKRPLRHIARFILIGLYTGSRASAIAAASPYRKEGHSYVDFDTGVFHRLPKGKRATNKRQPPVALPDRLIAHMRRWHDKKLIHAHFVEWHGKKVASVKTGFGTTVGLSELDLSEGNVTPHTLRHTAATWLMQRGVDLWEASGFLGMSPETLKNVYGHHHPNFMRNAAKAITTKDPIRKREIQKQLSN